MSWLSSWVIGIAGVCFISVIADLLLSGGKTSVFIKNVISYAVILVIILPLPNLFNKDFLTKEMFSNLEVNVQDDFIYNLNQNKLDALVSDIETDLKNLGILGIQVSISANIFDNPMQIDAVYVDLYNVVISQNNANINIKTEVVNVVQKYIEISDDKVIFYEWE